ncbi:hypothetical protein PVK06_001288 [Gossypium arboreum]|uniref:DUF4283 domain-containing protein n=1 Tax=Gossypium arboreum TaxID=29729 RepID=A0ABR0R1P2_GOSAR|nr:hypothetical protein PVK06_001288 [Gossypium arboreum]
MKVTGGSSDHLFCFCAPMEDELVNLYLANEEEEAFQEDPKNSTNDLQFCLVGSCLTDSVVHFPSLRNTLANLWHPIRGIAIMDLGDKRYMFKFFYVVDMNRVVSPSYAVLGSNT